MSGCGNSTTDIGGSSRLMGGGVEKNNIVERSAASASGEVQPPAAKKLRTSDFPIFPTGILRANEVSQSSQQQQQVPEQASSPDEARVPHVQPSSSSRQQEERERLELNKRRIQLWQARDDRTDPFGDGEKFQTTLIGEKYLLLEPVEGSSLFRCVDVTTEEELVCKVVPPDSHAVISAHYRLDAHPRISALHEVLMCNWHMYLVFPRAHGDLHSYVRARKRLRETEAKKMFRQIAEVVQACHRQGIVLRDLKLRKFVFADPERTQLKLESLEDAVILEEPDSDLLHDKRGCPAYVSPEILKVGAHYSGKAADMWSLGVILYTMLVGRYPFNGPEHSNLFAKISRGHFVIPECLSSRVRCLIRSLMRRAPHERITSEDIMHHPWLAKEDRDFQSRCYDQLVPDGGSFYDDDNDDDL